MMNLVKSVIRNNYRKAQLWLSFFIIFALLDCEKKAETIVINGFTMGTTYSIKIVNTDKIDFDTNLLKIKIDSVLISVNQQMSTYIEDSEISIFNDRNDKEWQNISSEFSSVISKAIDISNMTHGAFDITVGPLMDLWGFGKTGQDSWHLPEDSKVDHILDYVGFDKINITACGIQKSDTRTVIDLNAIAKGFGVDVVFELLKNYGYKNILVEIGGEIRCGGFNQNGDFWRVGIDKPIFDILPGHDLHDLITLNNVALATSGDYRNYFIYEGKIYSHTIDPRSGYPIENGIASASVTAPNCMLADALATALMVMGESGLKLINELENVEALIIKRIDVEEFESVKTNGWSSN